MGWQDAPPITSKGGSWKDAPVLEDKKPAWMSAPAAKQEVPPERTQLPQDQRSQDLPAYRQGSIEDVADRRPLRERLNKPFYGPPTPTEYDLGQAGSMASRALTPALEKYEEYVAGPWRRTAFKEDPLVTLQKNRPVDVVGPQALWEDVKQVGVGLLTDPLAILGGPALRSARPRFSRPAGQPDVPVTAPVVDYTPSAAPPSQATPSISDLARQSPAQGYERYQGPGQRLEQGSQFPQRGMEINQLPTGSLERSLEPRVPTVGQEPALRSLPTGSMVRIQKPATETAVSPLTAEHPPLPSMRPGPVDKTSDWQSRRLHGRPPESEVPTAESLLAAKAAEQQARYESWLSERSTLQGVLDTKKLPTAPKDGEWLDPNLQQAEQPRLGPYTGPELGLGPTLSQSTPGTTARLLLHSYDVLRRSGPIGARIADILSDTRIYSEIGTKQNALDYMDLLESLYGKPKLRTRIAPALRGDWATALNKSVKDYGITEAEQRALLELHYHGSKLPQDGPIPPETIQSHVSPKAWETVKKELLDPKVQELWRQGWKIATGRASAHPSIQEKATVYNPITGESMPVGPATSYWPHQPVTDQSKRLVSEHNLKKIYNRDNYAQRGITFNDFKERLKKHMQEQDPANEYRHYAGIENARLLDMAEDAKTHKRTLKESLEYYGYETDPIRMLVRHNTFALRRAKFLEHESELTALRQQMQTEYGIHRESFNDWTEKVIKYSQGISPREDAFSRGSKLWDAAQAILYPAFLKGSWTQNFLLQPNYAWMITGARPIAQGLYRYFGKKAGLSNNDIDVMIERAASNFPTFMAKYHMPDGPAAQYSKTMSTLNMFAWSDGMTRHLTSMYLMPHGENLMRKFYMNPTDKGLQKALAEGGIDYRMLKDKMSSVPRSEWEADGIPPVPKEFIQRYAHQMTNLTMGRTGVNSLPLWASGDSMAAKMYMMLHRQITSNEGVFLKHVLNAPTPAIGIARGLRFVFGAEAAGAMYQGVMNMIMDRDFFDVHEPLAKQMGSKEAAFMVKAVLLGAGTMTAGLMLSGLNIASGNFGGATYGILSPPAAAFTDEMVQKVLKGHPLDALMRLNPSQTFDILYRRHEEEARKRKKAGGLNPGVDMGM